MSVWETEELVAKISIRLAPASQSALDMFLKSVNNPTFLRTGLPRIDQALNGGLHCRALSEFVGTAGIGKSQAVMTLAVLCALDYPENGVMFFDVEHNFSPKRLLQITIARLRQMYKDQEVDINELAGAVIQRIRVIRVNSIATFATKFKEVEKAMHSLKIKLLIIDCVSTLFVKASSLTISQRQHQMLKLARDLKVFADTYKVFVVVTNRATTVVDEGGLCTRPQLGECWAHCVTTRFIMEQHALYRAITIAKSSVSGYIVQPFAVKERGVEADEGDEKYVRASDDFSVNDEFLSNIPLASGPMLNSARRPSQQSNTEDSNTTQRVEVNDGDYQSNQDTESTSFDIVSDSNSDEGNDSFDLDIVFEE